jgi:cyanophycin synthetase
MNTPADISHAKRCVYCGNNPVNHELTYISETLSALMSKQSRPGHGIWDRLSTDLEARMMRTLYKTLHVLHVLRFKKEGEPLSDRSKVIWEEAKRRGLSIEQGFVGKKPTEHFRVFTNNEWHYFLSIPIFKQKGGKADTWVDNKATLKQFFEKHGIRVPKGARASSVREAIATFDALTKPVIVKPEVGSRGRHTTTHIYTKEEMEKAFHIAQKLCRYVVIEEHLVGSVYRGTYVGGEVVGVLRGEPPRVTGDGVSTLRSLIEKKNKEKHVRQKDVVISASSEAFLKRQGYTLDSILPDGLTIDLTEKIGLSYGGFAAEDFPQAHPKLLATLTTAGNLLSFPLIGFDFISEDITEDPDTVRWGIIEANTLPFIDLHHFPVEGEPINVARKVWDLWERSVL